MSATSYHLRPGTEEKIGVADEEDDWNESPTSVTQLRDEIGEMLTASEERLEALAKKADRLKRFLNRNKASYPKIAAVLEEQRTAEKKNT